MDIIRRLPPYVGRSIVEYLDPRTSSIKFRKMTREWAEKTNYLGMYKMAYIEDPDFGEIPLQKQLRKSYTVKTTLFLSKISKKKEQKDRYYLTFQTIEEECDSCGSPSCNGMYCRGQMHNDTFYTSKFIGHSMEVALAEFDKYTPTETRIDI